MAQRTLRSILAVALVTVIAAGWPSASAVGQVAGTFRTPLGGEPATLDP
jgi:hypothetical protein